MMINGKYTIYTGCINLEVITTQQHYIFTILTWATNVKLLLCEATQAICMYVMCGYVWFDCKIIIIL